VKPCITRQLLATLFERRLIFYCLEQKRLSEKNNLQSKKEKVKPNKKCSQKEFAILKAHYHLDVEHSGEFGLLIVK
jgi:hypothetical protein